MIVFFIVVNDCTDPVGIGWVTWACSTKFRIISTPLLIPGLIVVVLVVVNDVIYCRPFLTGSLGFSSLLISSDEKSKPDSSDDVNFVTKSDALKLVSLDGISFDDG